MVASTVERVTDHTSASANHQIMRGIAESIRWHAAHPEGIDRRLRELDREWDIERTLETNAATLAFTGVALAYKGDRRWLALPALVTAFLLQHAIQGWCPPLPVLRRLGFHTAREIDTERYALKALRGDFGPIGPGPHDHDSRASHALQAARL
ncbi:hypothetical protein [Microvirga sp. 17 mud 1-3]|uniref:hypothetical protein n=1 Tax=Microvirga sp. 17 mud 1-3 TaxID=2082949 RepID=UPI000D6CD996|nr:hypothetical protein [Microvirga sp. 17 mud 1-3]AWM86540.1 hypothetical protein C4E04_07215 [Microvirga sp. 17 mud 1-3]